MLKELNLVINYIEDHLTDELSLEETSEYAGVSDYHFDVIKKGIKGANHHLLFSSIC